jgi:hypothetical protein
MKDEPPFSAASASKSGPPNEAWSVGEESAMCFAFGTNNGPPHARRDAFGRRIVSQPTVTMDACEIVA